MPYQLLIVDCYSRTPEHMCIFLSLIVRENSTLVVVDIKTCMNDKRCKKCAIRTVS